MTEIQYTKLGYFLAWLMPLSWLKKLPQNKHVLAARSIKVFGKPSTWKGVSENIKETTKELREEGEAEREAMYGPGGINV
jgi:hypothetical protein